jgi:hypothetical protein
VGPGAALNIRGELRWGPPSGIFVELVPTSLGRGERDDLRVHWATPAPEDWTRVTGELTYDDIAGNKWTTLFEITEREQVRSIDVTSVLDTSKPWRAVAGSEASTGGRPASPSN